MKKIYLFLLVALLGILEVNAQNAKESQATNQLSAAVSANASPDTKPAGSENVAPLQSDANDPVLSRLYTRNHVFEKFDPTKEDLSKRTENSKHFPNGDDTYTAVLTSGPSHYWENGGWRTMSNDIAPTQNSQFPFANLHSGVKTWYGKDISEGIKIVKQDGIVFNSFAPKSIIALNKQGTVIGTLYNANANAPLLTNDRYRNLVKYSEAFPHTELSVEQSKDRIKTSYYITQDIFNNLPQGTGTVAFVEKIQIPAGATAQKIYEDGFKDPKVAIQVKMGDSVILTYRNAYFYDDTASGNRVKGANADIDFSVSGNELEFRILLPAAYLTDSAIQYPLTVDPTIYPNYSWGWTATVADNCAWNDGNMLVGFWDDPWFTSVGGGFDWFDFAFGGNRNINCDVKFDLSSLGSGCLQSSSVEMYQSFNNDPCQLGFRFGWMPIDNIPYSSCTDYYYTESGMAEVYQYWHVCQGYFAPWTDYWEADGYYKNMNPSNGLTGRIALQSQSAGYITYALDQITHESDNCCFLFCGCNYEDNSNIVRFHGYHQSNPPRMIVSYIAPLGNVLTRPIPAGTITCGSTFTGNSSNYPPSNNAASNCYGSDVPSPLLNLNSSHDIWYSFTLSSAQTVNISTCGSDFNTYVSLWNNTNGTSGGTTYRTANDNDGPLCSGTRASLRENLPAGNYLVAVEGSGGSTGNVVTTISIPGAVLGTVSNLGPIDFCGSDDPLHCNFNLTSPVIQPISVTGYVGNPAWEWGSSDGAWNSWALPPPPNISGTSCFPPKIAAVDNRADRIKLKVSNCGTPPEVTILVRNHWNTALNGGVIPGPDGCTAGYTLTANFLDPVNILGTVEFFDGATPCTGTIIATVPTTAGGYSVTTFINNPTPGIHRYSARYNPGNYPGCTPTSCTINGQVTVVPNPDPPTTAQLLSHSSGTTVCAGTVLSVGGVASGGAEDGVNCGFEYQYSTDNGINWLPSPPPASPYNLTITGTSGNGTTATLTFPTQASVPFAVGTPINVTGVTPTAYNGGYVVVASPAPTTSTVSYASTASGAQIGGLGNVSKNVPFTFVAVAGSNNNLVRARRANCGGNCPVSAWSNPAIASWSGAVLPTSPVSAPKNPNVAALCAGATLSLTGPAVGGIAGTGCPINYRHSNTGIPGTDPGASWTNDGTSLPSFTAQHVLSGSYTTNLIQAWRECSGSCPSTTPVTVASWLVYNSPDPPSSITFIPAPGSVCAGSVVNLDATVIPNPTGGDDAACTFEYRYSTNSGLTWTTTTTPSFVIGTGIAAVSSSSGNNIVLAITPSFLNTGASGTRITFSTSFGNGANPVVAGTTYYVLTQTGSTITISATLNGAVMNVGTGGTGNLAAFNNLFQARRTNCASGCTSPTAWSSSYAWSGTAGPTLTMTATQVPVGPNTCERNRSGAISLSITSFFDPETSYSCHHEFRYSTDNGVTWSTPVYDTPPSFTAVAGVNIMQVRRVNCPSCSGLVGAWQQIALWNVGTAPVGATVSTAGGNPGPIDLGILTCSGLSSTLSNNPDNCYGDYYTGTNNQSSDDIFYKFTTDATNATVLFSTCGSGFNTYIHLLDANGNLIRENDNNGPALSGCTYVSSEASIQYELAASTTYILVVEGNTSLYGSIVTTIDIVEPSSTVTGNSLVCYGETGVRYSVGTINVTKTNSGTNIIECTSTADLQTNTRIMFSESAGGLVAGTTYYVRTIAAGQFTVSLTFNGPDVTLSPAAGLSIKGAINAYGFAWSVPAGASITSGQGTNSILVNFGTATSGAISCVQASLCPITASLTLSIKGIPQTLTGGGEVCVVIPSFVSIGLSASEPGVRYDLYRDDTPDPDILIATITAANYPNLSFGSSFFIPTNYYVIATPTGRTCTVEFPDQISITNGDPDRTFTVEMVDPEVCPSPGLVVTLSGSESDVDYQVLFNQILPTGTAVPGGTAGTFTGGTVGTSPFPITFNSISYPADNTSWDYYVRATGANGCVVSMTDYASGLINEAPAAQSVTYGGLTGIQCNTGLSVRSVRLAASTAFVNYQLYKDGVAVGSPVSGGVPPMGTVTGYGYTGQLYTAVATTDGTTNTINTIYPTSGLTLNQAIVFSNNWGGFTAGTVYYVKSIPSTYSFTISATAGGTELTPTSNQLATITSTTSGNVINAVGHTFVAGDPVTFSNSFGSIVAGTVYYARTIVAGTSFTVAATFGGTSNVVTGTTGTGTAYISPNVYNAPTILATASSSTGSTITTTAVHNLTVNTPIIFAATFGTLKADSVYYVQSVTTTTFTITSAYGGTVRANVGTGATGSIYSAIGIVTRSGTPITQLDFVPPSSTLGVYTVVATDMKSGCTNDMSGSVVIQPVTGQQDIAGNGVLIADGGTAGNAPRTIRYCSGTGDVVNMGVRVRSRTIASSSTTNITTTAAHGFTANQLVVFGSSFTGITAGTNYFVRTVVSATVFSVSATQGGTAITVGTSATGIVKTSTYAINYELKVPLNNNLTCTSVAATATTPTPHGMSNDDIVRANFTSAGVVAGQLYYVTTPTTSQFRLSTQPAGTSAVLLPAAGTGLSFTGPSIAELKTGTGDGFDFTPFTPPVSVQALNSLVNVVNYTNAFIYLSVNPHNIAIGTKIKFSNGFGTSGNILAGTPYYVTTGTANNILCVSNTLGGAALSVGTGISIPASSDIFIYSPSASVTSSGTAITTSNTHGLPVGTPIKFDTNVGSLTAGIVYYVATGSTGSTLYVASSYATIGSPINVGNTSDASDIFYANIYDLPVGTTSSTSGTVITTPSNHALLYGAPITFDKSFGAIVQDTIYYVQSASTNNGTVYKTPTSNSSGTTINCTSHGIANNTAIVFNATTISNVIAGIPYYVTSTGANTFTIASSPGGPAISVGVTVTASTPLYTPILNTFTVSSTLGGSALSIGATSTPSNIYLSVYKISSGGSTSGCSDNLDNGVAVIVKTPPTVTAAATDYTLCPYETINLTATPAGGSGTGTYYSYTWAGPSSYTSGPNLVATASRAPTLTPVMSGVYTVTVSDIFYCTGTNSAPALTVYPLPENHTVTTPSGLTSFCFGPAQTIQLTGSESDVTYDLLNAAGESFNPSTYIFSPDQTSIGTYTVVATTAANSCTATMPGSVIINPIPVSKPLTTNPVDYDICTYTPTNIYIPASENGVAYQLKLNGANTGSTVAGTGSDLPLGGNPQTWAVGTYTAAGIFPAVTPTGTGAAGANTISVSSATGIYVGQEVVGTGIGNNATVTAVSGTTITLSVVNTGAVSGILTFGCLTDMSQSVIVRPAPVNQTFTTTDVTTPNGPFCEGPAITFKLNAAEASTTYLLKFNTTTTVATQNSTTTSGFAFSPTQTADGSYTVLATNSYGCTANMGSAIVINPTPDVLVMSGGITFCETGSPVSFTMDSSFSGVSYQLKKNGVSEGSAQSGGGGSAPYPLNWSLSAPGTYSVVANINTCSATMSGTNLVINAKPVVQNFTTNLGDGPFCGVTVTMLLDDAEAGILYELYMDYAPTGVDHTPSSAGTFNFSPAQNAVGEYYVVATNPATGCTADMSPTVIINSAPAVQTVNGGGPYCYGVAHAIGIDGSETGVTYQLYRDATAVGSSQAGTGSALGFGSHTDAGTYTIKATFGDCIDLSMGGSVVINPIPTAAFAVTGGGADCSSTFTGFSIGLDDSESGVSYQLFNGVATVGSPVSGTGSAITFGNQTIAGNYTVVGTGPGGCSATMSGSQDITINASPTPYSVTGGVVAVCSDASGAPVGLDGSESGFNYQLYRDASTVGSPVAGTGSALAFGDQTVGGTYTVVATHPSTTCSRTMTGSSVITITETPATPTVTADSTTGCGSTTISAELTGTGRIYWQNTASSGTYTSASTTATGSNTQSTIVVASSTGIIIGMSVTATGTAPGAFVTGIAGTTITLSAPNTADVNGPADFSAQSSFQRVYGPSPVTYYFRAENDGCWGAAGSVAVTINPLPPAPTVTQQSGAVCSSDVLTATVSGGHPVYWQNDIPDGNQGLLGGSPQTVYANGTYYYQARNATTGCWGPSGGFNVVLSTLDFTVVLDNCMNVAYPVSISTTGSGGVAPASTTATGNISQSTITVASSTGIVVGMNVAGDGIATNATVTSIAGAPVITLSAANTANVNGPVSFFKLSFDVTDPTGITTGLEVAGTGIGAASRVTGVSTNTITVSRPLAGVVSGTVNFTSVDNKYVFVTPSGGVGPYTYSSTAYSSEVATPSAAITGSAVGNAAANTLILAVNPGILTGMKATGSGIGTNAYVTDISFLPSQRYTGTGSIGNYTFTVTSTAGLLVGMAVTGGSGGIATDAVVTNISGLTITVDIANVAGVSGDVDFTGYQATLSVVNSTGVDGTITFTQYNKMFEQPVLASLGGTETFTITDAIGCTKSQVVDASTGHPTNIPYPTASGTPISVNCFDFGYNKWITFRNPSIMSQALLSINDKGQDLGIVTATLYRESAELDIKNIHNAANGGTGNCIDHPTTSLKRHYVITSQNTVSASPGVGVRLYFSKAELDELATASVTGDSPNCDTVDNVLTTTISTTGTGGGAGTYQFSVPYAVGLGIIPGMTVTGTGIGAGAVVTLNTGNPPSTSIITVNVANTGAVGAIDFNAASINYIHVTKYHADNRALEDGDYANNASGIYKLYGPSAASPLDAAVNNGFHTLFSGASSAGGHNYIEFQVTDLSEFWIHGLNSPSLTALPVELIYLEAEAMENTYIQVRWATALEINNDGFKVERSTDAQTWTQIGWVDGHDNSTVQNNYHLNDYDVIPGVRYYYRLKQMDNDGQFEYTGIVSAIINTGITFNVKDFVPNPTMDKTSLIVVTSGEQEITVDMYDILGRKILASVHQLHKGGNRIEFNLGNFASGTYTAIVTSANEIYSKKLVLTR